MARIREAIVGSDRGWAQNRFAPMTDLRYGGQNGFGPEYAQWINNQAQVDRNIICLLVEAPVGFNYLPNPEYWIGTLRHLVEVSCLSIEGLSGNIEVVVEDTSNVGGSNEMHEDFTNVTLSRSQPKFVWHDRYGMPVYRFFRGWIYNLLMDPHSKVANIATLANVPGDMLADMYSATMAFIEPDPTHHFVVKSWLSTNMYPKGISNYQGRKDKTQAAFVPRYDIEFTAITQQGDGVDQYCTMLLRNIDIQNANPSFREAFTVGMTDIDEVSGLNVNVRAQNHGHETQVGLIQSNNLQVP